jgi:rod shape-determining protein MreB and related proteins
MINRDIGIDLGTDTVRIYIRKKGIVLNEPAVLVIDRISKELLAVGKDAYSMIGRTPRNILSVRPVRDGIIADYECTVAMLKYFLAKLGGTHFIYSYRVLICCATKSTALERQSIIDVVQEAGCKQINLVDKVKASAIGAGVDISQPYGNMVVDIGRGTTDIAVLSLGTIVAAASITAAGNRLDCNIEQFMKETHGLIIGEQTAEKIKMQAVMYSHSDQDNIEVRGRDHVTGLPHTVHISSQELESVIMEWALVIVNACKSVLEQTSPELSGDILCRGITITGGGSLVRGLDQFLAKELMIPVTITENPLFSVVEGISLMLGEKDFWRKENRSS